MDEENESKLVNYLKIALMVAIALTVSGLVWWQMKSDRDQPAQDVVVPSEEVATIEAPQPVQPELQPGESVVLDEPELISADEEQESVLQVIEETTEVDTPSDQLTLATSDLAVQQSLSGLSPDALPLVVKEHVLRKFVRAVNALDDGNLVNQYRPFVLPVTPFSASQKGEDEWSLDESNYRRYQPYIEVAEAMGPEQLVELYGEYRPMLEEAFKELGTDKSDFNSTLKNALKELLKAPETNTTLELVRPSVMYKYQDKRLESLSAPQKLMLRIGPENRKRVKALAQSILDELPDK